jgi:hypothetical protein
MKAKGMSGIHTPKMGKDEWLTPPEIIHSLGEFDLDPCSPIRRPWRTADVHMTIDDNGLAYNWYGRVWLNPPYGKEAGKWLAKLAEHGNGIALIFARTETEMFFDHVWNKAHSLLFIKGRLHFHHVDGSRAKCNSGAPSVLIAYGQNNSTTLENCKIEGKFVRLR